MSRRHRRLGGRRAHLHRDREPGPAVHGRGGLQRVGPRPADRDDDRPTARSARRSTSGTTTATACRCATPAGSSSSPKPTRRRSTCTSRRSGSPRSCRCPVMVCMDGFILTHAYERVDMPDAGRRSTRSCRRTSRARCSTRASRCRIGAMVGPGGVHRSALPRAPQAAARRSTLIPQLAAEFAQRFGRDSGGLVRALPDRGRRDDRRRARLGDRHDQGRRRRDARRGRRASASLGICSFRPFPLAALRDALQAREARRRAGEELSPSASAASSPTDVRMALSRHHAARLHGHRRPRRPRDHEGVAATACSRDADRDELEPLTFLDLDARRRRARARARDAACAARGPTAEEHPARRRHRRIAHRLRPTMTHDQPVKFYQTGTFTVGNRLLGRSSARCRPTCERTQLAQLRAIARARAAARRSARATRSTPRCARRGNQLIAVNATGCLEVFSTPYPETSWQIPWIHSLFGNAAAVGTGIAAAHARRRAATDVRVDRAGRRRRHHRHRLRLPVGHVRAQRRRALHLLRQRGLHEHRRAALSARRRRRRAPRRRRPSAPQPGNVFGTGQERAADRDGARHPVRRDRHRRRPARPRAQGRARRWRSAARATSTSSCRARSAGARRPHDTITARAARARERDSSRCSRRVRRGHRRSRKIRRRVPVEDYLKPQRRFAHLFGAAPRIAHDRAHPGRSPTATSRASACSRAGGRRHDAKAVRDHARRRLVARQPHRLVAHRAPGLRRPAAAVQPRVPGRRRHPGLALPRRERRLRSGVAAARRATTRSRRSWAASAITRARPRAIAASSTTPVGINSVERFLGDEAIKHGWTFDAAGAGDRQARARRRRGPVRACRPPITCARSVTT